MGIGVISHTNLKGNIWNIIKMNLSDGHLYFVFDTYLHTGPCLSDEAQVWSQIDKFWKTQDYKFLLVCHRLQLFWNETKVKVKRKGKEVPIKESSLE